MLEGVSFESFKADMMRRIATERFLEIICEAAHKLPHEVKQAAPDIVASHE
jgi:uncharacterized protein with HEPN domain